MMIWSYYETVIIIGAVSVDRLKDLCKTPTAAKISGRNLQFSKAQHILYTYYILDFNDHFSNKIYARNIYENPY
jgi:acyl-ACP thioesterase